MPAVCSTSCERVTALAVPASSLRNNRSRDAAAGRTTKGPHRQDLAVLHRAKSMPAAQSSTGEQKALLLGLVLAHAELVAERRGEPPILLLDTVGARSGTKRTTPLAYVEDGDDVAIIASKGGHPKHPAWFHNLLAHPDTTVQIGREHRAVHARVANTEERGRLWPKAVAAWGDYSNYQERTEREIPVVVLERA